MITSSTDTIIYFTNNLVAIGKIHGIFIIDHIIIGNDSFYSFYENGKIK